MRAMFLRRQGPMGLGSTGWSFRILSRAPARFACACARRRSAAPISTSSKAISAAAASLVPRATRPWRHRGSRWVRAVARFRPGDRVGMAWLRWTCGACDFCGTGAENLCECQRYTGYHEDGGYAELALVLKGSRTPSRRLLGYGRGSSPVRGIIGYRALRRTEMRARRASDSTASAPRPTWSSRSPATAGTRCSSPHGRPVTGTSRGGSAPSGLGTRPSRSRPRSMRRSSSRPPARSCRPPSAPCGRAVFVVLAGIHMSPIPTMEYGPHLFHEKTLLERRGQHAA